MNELTATERKVVSEFLEDLSDRMGNAVCNDYEMPDTPENRQLLQAAYEYGITDDPFDMKRHTRSKGKLLCMDFIIVNYLADKLAGKI